MSLKWVEQAAITDAVNHEIPKELVPEAQNEEGSRYYDELIEEKEEFPGVWFSYPEMDLEEEEVLRDILYGDDIS